MNGPALVLDRAEADDRAEFRQAVLAGLAHTPRAIPAKFLYDARGSALFDQICELPEYYLTRTETGILRPRLRAGRVRQRLERKVSPPARGAARSFGLCADRHLARASGCHGS